jgi:hypothetical protein
MNYFFLQPEVAGGLGEDTVLTRDTHPPIVTKLHYEIDVWLGDALLEGFPCFILIPELAEAIVRAELTGAGIAPVKVTPSGIFEDLNPGRKLPEFRWLKLAGMPGRDDMAADEKGNLVVSERALRILKRFQLKHCEVAPWVPS